MACLCLVLVAAICLRFVGGERAPRGFHFDEAIIAGEAISLAETGKSSLGTSGLFIPAGGGGYASATHVYPKAVWIRLAGYSVAAMRAYAALEATLLIAGLWLLGSRLYGSAGGAYTALAGALSPWIFQFSRLANDDPMMCLCGIVWGSYFVARRGTLRSAAAAALCFSIAAYAYSSARVVLPLIAPAMMLMHWRGLRRPWANIAVFTLTGLLLCSPLLAGTLSGRLLTRYDVVGIFTESFRAKIGASSNWQVLPVFVRNYMEHLSLRFLFLSGDPNLRHSTQSFGQLSWLDQFALLGGLTAICWRAIRRKGLSLDSSLVFSFLGFLVGFIPAAITWEGLPHSIRGCVAWPFAALVTGGILAKLKAHTWWIRVAVPLLGSVYLACFAGVFFTSYPTKAAPHFDVWQIEAAEHGRASGDWNRLEEATKVYPSIVARYYLVAYGGLTFAETADVPATFARLRERNNFEK